MKKQQVKIYFENKQDKIPVTYHIKMLLRSAVIATLKYEDYNNDCEVSVTFTDNEGIRELNNRFRGIDRETDVLSFPLFDYDNELGEPAIDELENAFGDIVISLEKAEAQAEEYGHSMEREVAFLCAHSMLHLLGYDHELSEEDDADMRRRQDGIMKMMGLDIKSNDESENNA